VRQRRAVQRQRRDQPAVGAADAARHGHEAAELADHVGQQEVAGLRGGPERLEGRLERGDVEGQVAQRAGDHPDPARAQEPHRVAHAVGDGRADVRRAVAQPGEAIAADRRLGPAGQHARQREDADDRQQREARPDRRRRDRRVAGQHAGQHERPRRDDAEEVHRARDEEERDGPPRDLAAGHPEAAQRPGAERQTARAAGRQQHVGGLLGEAELRAEAPGHAAAEHAAEDDDERGDRAQLEQERRHDPDGLRAGQAGADLAQPRQGREQQQADPDDERDLRQPGGEVARGEGVGHRISHDSCAVNDVWSGGPGPQLRVPGADLRGEACPPSPPLVSSGASSRSSTRSPACSPKSPSSRRWRAWPAR